MLLSQVVLTKRQKEVLVLLVDGLSRSEIAERLSINKRTVEFHIANLYDKLQVCNRAQAYRMATRLGLL